MKAIRENRQRDRSILKENARSAFTLIEFVIVILLMAIAVGLVIPSAAPQTEQQLRAAAHLVAAEVELARDLAITYNSKYKLVLDTKDNRVVLTHVGENSALNQLPRELVNNTTSDATHRITDLSQVPGLWNQVRIAACAEFGVTIAPNNAIVFEPTGATNNGKSFLIWLKAGQSEWTRYVTVIFDQSTGQVSIGTMSGVAPPF